jgi:hypothetical protein
MTKKFDFVPPNAVPSPDESREIKLEAKHYNAVFAVMLADEIGYFDPLIARLRDPKIKLEPFEREFLADNWGKRLKGGGRKLDMYRKYLGMAAYYLEFDKGEPRKGRKTEAEKFAAAKYGIDDTSEVRRAVRFAKKVNYGPWPWWAIASKMARESKFKQLHRTY